MVAQQRKTLGGDRRAFGCAPAGFSLLELMAVLTLIGLLATVSLSTLPQRMGNLSTKVDARRIVLDLVHCRRAAIATGDNHVLVLNYSGKAVNGYTPSRRTAKGLVPVEQPRTFPGDVKAEFSGGEPEFTFEGSALASYEIVLTATSRVTVVTVVQATGSAQVSEK
ncbi:MAG: prepilin-type N-terminal cleavage/methylation domain-containing protein [Pirellulales bacterium]|nr:prepilin-type N-terminal cleavage/methylation domain-containing protein [Pirellulales bacterium]